MERKIVDMQQTKLSFNQKTNKDKMNKDIIQTKLNLAPKKSLNWSDAAGVKRTHAKMVEEPEELGYWASLESLDLKTF